MVNYFVIDVKLSGFVTFLNEKLHLGQLNFSSSLFTFHKVSIETNHTITRVRLSIPK